jgi:hypothetical protein
MGRGEKSPRILSSTLELTIIPTSRIDSRGNHPGLHKVRPTFGLVVMKNMKIQKAGIETLPPGSSTVSLPAGLLIQLPHMLQQCAMSIFTLIFSLFLRQCQQFRRKHQRKINWKEYERKWL